MVCMFVRDKDCGDFGRRKSRRTKTFVHQLSAYSAVNRKRVPAVRYKRRENIENYIKRLEKLEEIANSFNGVDSSYAVQAGREIRILVKPEVVSDDQMVLLSHDIVKRIEDELEYPGQIKVNVIRENRAIDYAK